jgi:nitrate/nitrite-specific signal transduction histidine kinase
MIKIEKAVIAEVRGMKDSPLYDIEYRLSRSYNKKKDVDETWGGQINAYVGIKGTNLVICHVRNAHCVTIPRYIETCEKQIIDVVGQMIPCYWGYSTKGDVVDTANKAGYLPRAVMSIQKYGTAFGKLPDGIEIHHKGPRYLNTIESMMTVTVERHDQIHKITSGCSHREEKNLRTADELLDFIEKIKVDNETLKYKIM